MFYYILLMFILLFFSIVAFKLSKGDFFSPLTIFPVMFLFVSLLSIVGRSSWNRVDLSFNVFLIVVLGVFGFIIGGLFLKLFACRFPLGGSKPGHAEDKTWRTCESYSIYFIFIAILFIAIYLRISETYRLGKALGFDTDNYMTLAKNVRDKFALFRSTANVLPGQGYSMLSKQFEKVAIMGGFIGAYFSTVGIRKFLRTKKYFIYIILPFFVFSLSCLFVILGGSRGWILYYIMAFVVCNYLFDCRNLNVYYKITFRYSLILLPIVIFIALLFFIAGSFIGRKASGSFTEYISFYFGCGIPSMQDLISSGQKINSSGYASFYGIDLFFYKVGLLPKIHSYSLGWVFLNGHGSNVFTLFFRYYYDFGFWGVFLLSFVQGFAFCLLYLFIRRHSSAPLVLLYIYVYPYIVDSVREDFFFSRLLSSSTLISIAIGLCAISLMTIDFKPRTVKRKHEQVK